jgi:hypothetical protein
MVEVVQPSMDYLAPGNQVTHLIGPWEFDFYIGWIGLAFLVGFGIWAWLRDKNGLPDWMKALYAPMLVLFVLSMGQIYEPVFMLKIPLLTAERVTSRFWTLPFVFLIFFGAIGLQKNLQGKSLSKLSGLVYFSGLLILVNDLMRNMDLWNVKYMDLTLPRELFDYALRIQNNTADTAYLNMIAIGCLLSLATLGFLLFQYGKTNGFFSRLTRKKAAQ